MINSVCDGCREKINYEWTDLIALEIKWLELKKARTLRFFWEFCQEDLKLLPKLQLHTNSLESKFELLQEKLDLLDNDGHTASEIISLYEGGTQ